MSESEGMLVKRVEGGEIVELIEHIEHIELIEPIEPIEFVEFVEISKFHPPDLPVAISRSMPVLRCQVNQDIASAIDTGPCRCAPSPLSPNFGNALLVSIKEKA